MESLSQLSLLSYTIEIKKIYLWLDFPNATNKFNAIWLFGMNFISSSRDFFFFCVFVCHNYFDIFVFCHLCRHSTTAIFYGVSPFNYYDHKNSDHVWNYAIGARIFHIELSIVEKAIVDWPISDHPSDDLSCIHHPIINIFSRQW